MGEEELTVACKFVMSPWSWVDLSKEALNSITFSDIEILFPPNDDGGVEDIVNNLKPLVSAFNVTPGDLIYFAAATALTNCAGAPRIQFFAGRPDPLGPAPDGTVNSPGGKWMKV